MKKWFVVDDSTKMLGLITERVLKATTREEAIEEGRWWWENLTRSERRGVNDFYVCYAEEVDEDGYPDYNTCSDFYSLKDEWEKNEYED